jgi:hypothetical protein
MFASVVTALVFVDLIIASSILLSEIAAEYGDLFAIQKSNNSIVGQC